MPLRYPLPKNLANAFEQHLRVASAEEIAAMRTNAQGRVERLYKQSDELVGPNFELAEALVHCCSVLIDDYEKLTSKKQAIVSAAVGYFLKNLDQIPDETPILGFDDDARVMNHALEKLGRSDLYLSFDE